MQRLEREQARETQRSDKLQAQREQLQKKSEGGKLTRQEQRQLQRIEQQQVRDQSRDRLEQRGLAERKERREALRKKSQQGKLSRTEQRQLRRLENQEARDRLLEQRKATREARGVDRPRREGRPRVTLNEARQARFAARFQDRADRKAARFARIAARQAWRQGRRAAFVAWLGPVFYPYAYSDIFEYTFWPYAYDDGYWAYAYDDFVGSMFWAEAAPYSDYAYAPARGGRATTGSAPSSSTGLQVCREPDKGVTAWPFEKIEQTVRPTAEQRALLDDLRRAAAEASAALKASCVNEAAMTPPGRLQAMTSRLAATLQAVKIVRPPLEKFYASLSDEQQARFNAMGPDLGQDNAARTARAAGQDQACGDAKPGLANLPIERIETEVQPTDAQQDVFDKLSQATDRAVDLLVAACPNAIALTPVGRLEAMENRLQAMVEAARTVQPALEDFYASLSPEQKARFNVLGRDTERGG